jgi:hypothetical protein
MMSPYLFTVFPWTRVVPHDLLCSDLYFHASENRLA